MLYDRVQSRSDREPKEKEKKFRRYVKQKIYEPTESEDSTVSDNETEIFDARTFLRNAQRARRKNQEEMSRLRQGGNVTRSDLEDARRAFRKDEEKLGKQWRKGVAARSEIIEDPQEKISQLLDFFNDITTETTQLIEVKDIIDELKIMVEIQKKQQEVFKKFLKVLESRWERGIDQSLEDAEARQMMPFAAKFSYQCSEIEALAEKAENTHRAVRDT